MISWDGEERRKITWDKIHESIHDLDLKITRIESHLKSELGGDGTAGNINSGIGEIRKLLEKQNGRVGSLERWRSGIVACLGLLVFIIGVFFKR